MQEILPASLSLFLLIVFMYSRNNCDQDVGYSGMIQYQGTCVMN